MTRKQINLFLAGASNTQTFTEDRSPLSGWGQKLGMFFKDEVYVVNHAISGRSSKSFITEGRLQNIEQSIGEGDYLFIHFGHNDASADERRHTDPVTTYKQYLMQYVEAARRHGATPVLITPVSKWNFDNEGKKVPTIPEYVEAVKQLGDMQGVEVLDLNATSEELLTQLGNELSQRLFIWLAPGEHPHYPEGKKDNSHFNEFGAMEIAKLVVQGIRELGLPMAAFLKEE